MVLLVKQATEEMMMDVQNKEKALMLLNDANTAMTGLITVMVQLQANLGMAYNLLGDTASTEVKESIEKAMEAAEGLVAAAAEQPAPVVEEEQPEPITDGVKTEDVANPLLFGTYARKILAPGCLRGGLGVVSVHGYRDSLFLGDGTLNQKRAIKWQSGFYNSGEELMLHTESFIVIYPRLREFSSIDKAEAIVLYKRGEDDVPPLHHFEKLDKVSYDELISETNELIEEWSAELTVLKSDI